MAEQSHKEEMRAALRGDFERLRERSRSAVPDRGRPERIVLTTSPEPEPMPEPAPVEAQGPELPPSKQAPSRPLLRRLLRRV